MRWWIVGSAVPQDAQCATLRLRVLLVAVLALAATACNPRYYTPNTHNIPLLRERGELALTLAIGGDRGELQGAYAVGDNIGVLFNSAFMRPEDDSEGDGGTGNFVEGGVGFFKPLGPRLTFETYGLLGVGDLENHFPSTIASNPGTTGNIEGKVVRYGVQSALGIASRHVDLLLSARLLSLRYSDVAGSLIFSGEDQVAYLMRESRHTLLEPAVTVRAGADFLKVQLQVGISDNMTTSNFRQDEGHASLGFVLYPMRAAGFSIF